ncbi:MAG: hypothetical protein AAF696_14705, partial [Bacteroidota bacterium]
AIIISFFLPLLTVEVSAQAVLGKEKMKRFPTESPWVYPVGLGTLDGQDMYQAFSPVLRINSGEFVHVWKAERTRYDERRVSKYNIFQETIWETDIKLEDEESIDFVYQEDEQIIVLGSLGKRHSKEQMIIAHILTQDSGKLVQTRIVHNQRLKSDQTLFFEASPDSSKLLYYYFQHPKPGIHTRVSYFYTRQDNRVGYRYKNVDKVHLKIFDRKLNLLKDAELRVNSPKEAIMDCRIDNDGNVYAISFEKPAILKAMQYNLATEEQQTIVYEDFLKPSDMNNRFNTRFPSFVGSGQKLYLPKAERKSYGRDKGTKAYELYCFDFQKGELDLSRRIDINPGLQIEIEKQRKELGIKPLKRFDEYLMRDIFETAGGDLWFLIQKFQTSSLENPGYGNYWEETVNNYELGEFIIFQFSPEGKAVKAMIIPSYQRISGFMERLFFDYHMQIDKEKGKISLLTYEPSEQKFRGPERVFWRGINLRNGEISQKKKIYEGERRYQFFLNPYTLWMNEDILSFIMIEGDNGSAYRISVNLAGEFVEEEKKSRKKSQAKKGRF